MESALKKWILAMTLVSVMLIGASLPFILIPGPINEASTPTPVGLEQPTEQLLLIVLDGVPQSVFDDANRMPFMAAFAEQGVKVPVHTSDLTLTGACVKEMATGRHAAPMDAILNWDVKNEVKNDPFYHAANRGDSVAFTGFYVWSNLYPDPMFTHETSPDYGFEDISEADDYALNVVDGWVENDTHHLMVAHLGGTDHAAHIHGLESPVYDERMRTLDHQLEELLASVPSDWTVLVTADHGVTNYGGHALGTGPAAEEVYLFAKGRGIADPISLEDPIQQRDISMLMSALLHLPLPASSDARIPLEMLDLSSSERAAYDAWNWENVLTHHAFMDDAGGVHLDDLPSEAAWERLDEPVERLPVFPFIATVMVALGALTWCLQKRPFSNVRLRQTRFQAPILIASVVVFVLVTFVVRDSDVLLATRWLRKLLGTLVVGLLAMWLVYDRREIGSFRIPVVVAGLAVLLFLYPETRYSMLATTLCFAGLYVVWTTGRDTFDLQERILLTVLLGLMAYRIVDYLPRLVTGLSVQALLNLDLLYKPMQRLVHSAMPASPLSLAVMWVLSIPLLFVQREEDRWKVDARPVLTITAIMVLASAQTMVTDWLLIGTVLVSIGARFSPTLSPRFEAWLHLRPMDVALFAWVGPTWGFYPALVVAFIGRIIPKLSDVLAQVLEGEGMAFHPIMRRAAYALTGMTLLFLVWFHFSLLTPLGLLEFNPSKVIVTGGFFGARTDPAVIWMGAMIVGPPLMALGYTYGCWAQHAQGEDTMLVMTLFLLSHALSYWTALMFTEYFVMLSTAALFYLMVVVTAGLVETARGLESRFMSESSDAP